MRRVSVTSVTGFKFVSMYQSVNAFLHWGYKQAERDRTVGLIQTVLCIVWAFLLSHNKRTHLAHTRYL